MDSAIQWFLAYNGVIMLSLVVFCLGMDSIYAKNITI
jgi:hypothetical protein